MGAGRVSASRPLLGLPAVLGSLAIEHVGEAKAYGAVIMLSSSAMSV